MFLYENVLKTIFKNTFLEVILQKPCSILRQEYLEKLLLLLNAERIVTSLDFDSYTCTSFSMASSENPKTFLHDI
jgi:hypothetical protein